MKKTTFYIFLIFGLLFCPRVFAENFYIKNYMVKAEVNVDKSVNVYEEITVYFTNPSHGIYRTIPLSDDDVEELYATEKHSIEYSNREITVKMGNPDRLVSGTHKYTVSYRLKIYDKLPEFYFNLIGTDWKVPIEFVTFSVKMPEKVDINKVGLSVGEYGKAGMDGEAVFNVRDNIIEGYTRHALRPHNGITLRVEVPDDYFTIVPDKRGALTALGIIILTFLSFVMWAAYGKDEHVVPVVSFNPPPDTDVADAELVLKEKATSNSLVAMIVQAAKNGYLQIESKGNDFTLYKKNIYKGEEKAVKKFLTALFSGGISSVSKKKLEESKTFYKGCREVLEIINKRRSRFFTKSSLNWLNRLIMLMFVLGVAGLSLFALMNFHTFSLHMVLGLLFFGFWTVCILAQRSITQLMSSILILAVLLAIVLPEFQYLFAYCSADNLKIVVLGGVCFFITLICLIQFPKLNIYGQQIKGHLYGLKKFIEVAEKPRLEQMVKDDPTYFYKILPYAYILGVSDKWIKQFESIMVKPLEEFGSRPLTAGTFNNFANGFGNTTLPSIQNGGISRSSGGGGFSGGGHGGGGGGSW